MLRPFVYLLAALLTFGSAAGAKQASRAVVIEAALDREAPGQSDFNLSLAQAFRNYLEYFFPGSGEATAVFLVRPEETAGYRERLSRNSSITSLTFLTVAGSLEDRLSSYTDRRRVSRFVTRPQCLELRVTYTTYERTGDTLEAARQGSLTERARRDWLKFDSGETVRRLDSLVAVTAEPNEYVVRRAIERLFPRIGKVAPLVATGNNVIPTVVVADSSYLLELGPGWRDEIKTLLAGASQFLSRDFSCSLDLQRIETAGPAATTDRSPAERFQDFRQRYQPSADTLIVGLYCQSSPQEFFGRYETDAIGLSVTGERVMLLRQLPLARPDRGLWRAHFNSLVLVHELGHVLGAVHVSDPQSIMCHNATWLAPNRWDPFNQEVIAAALAGDFSPGEPREYLEFISHRLKETPYHLVDYPPVLYRYLKAENLLEDSKIALRIIGRPPFLAAAEGFGRLIDGDRVAAAELFADAWRQDNKQACLPYYLAQATAGPVSIQALRSAADLGYWHAQLLLRSLSGRTENR